MDTHLCSMCGLAGHECRAARVACCPECDHDFVDPHEYITSRLNEWGLKIARRTLISSCEPAVAFESMKPEFESLVDEMNRRLMMKAHSRQPMGVPGDKPPGLRFILCEPCGEYIEHKSVPHTFRLNDDGTERVPGPSATMGARS